jgi:hypothetical protein
VIGAWKVTAAIRQRDRPGLTTQGSGRDNRHLRRGPHESPSLDPRYETRRTGHRRTCCYGARVSNKAKPFIATIRPDDLADLLERID